MGKGAQRRAHLLYPLSDGHALLCPPFETEAAARPQLIAKNNLRRLGTRGAEDVFGRLHDGDDAPSPESGDVHHCVIATG